MDIEGRLRTKLYDKQNLRVLTGFLLYGLMLTRKVFYFYILHNIIYTPAFGSTQSCPQPFEQHILSAGQSLLLTQFSTHISKVSGNTGGHVPWSAHSKHRNIYAY